jgi:hypothetical protein
MNSYWSMMQFKNYYQYSCVPEDDPRKGSKHVALPPTANKNKYWHSSVLFCLFQNYSCVDCPIIYLSCDTRREAYHKGCKLLPRFVLNAFWAFLHVFKSAKLSLLINSMKQTLLEIMIVAQLVRIFSVLYGNRRSITMLTRGCHRVCTEPRDIRPHPLILFLWDPFQHFPVCT